MTSRKTEDKEMQTSYVVSNLVKRYRQFELNVPDLHLYPGEIFCLLGPSGAGKTTLLKLLNFLERPDEGKMVCLGSNFTPKAYSPSLDIMRSITTVFQRPALLSESVWNNIVFPLKIRKEKVDREEIMGLAEQLGLTSQLHQSAMTLSGGEAQRVALARALVFKPRDWLLDEPTANLDPSNIKIIEDMVHSFAVKYKPTIVWITHNQFQAKRVGDRVCLMENGNVIETSNVDVFFNNPIHPRTQEFVQGSMLY